MTNSVGFRSQGMRKDRLAEIDLCRGLGIIFVVLGHSLKQTGESNVWFELLLSVIYSFHMPLFFFLSGFVALRLLRLSGLRQRAAYIRGRAVRLLVPYFVIGLFYLPVKYVLSSYAVQKYDFSEAWRLLLGENPNTALWFLYVLFLISVVCALLLNERSLGVHLAVSCAAAVWAYWTDSPWRFFKYWFFFLLGMYVRLHYDRYRLRLADWKRLGIGLVFFCAANTALYMTGAAIWNFPASLSGIVCCMALSVRAVLSDPEEASVLSVSSSFSEDGRLPGLPASDARTAKRWPWSVPAFLGRYSMDIYILSEPVMTAVKIVSWGLLGWNYLLCTALCLLAGLCLPIPLSDHLIRKVKLLRLAFLGEKQ